MKWDLSEDDYPQIEIHDNHVSGLSSWIEKIIDLAPNFDNNWNVLVADLWPNDNMSRLIGHVQMNDVVIGYDTGFRVCAYLENNGIVGDLGDDMPLVNQWLSDAVSQQVIKQKLRTLASFHPFKIRLTCWGEGEISDAIEINF